MAVALQALSSCAVLVVLLLLVPHTCKASTTTTTTTLQDKCEKYAGGTQSEYDFCMRMMQADKASAAADARGLAVIAARIARAMANATGGKIAMELRRGGAAAIGAARLDCLSGCTVWYGAAVRRLGHAVRVAAGPTGGGAWELRDAQALLYKAYGAPELCDGEFKEAGLTAGSSPITDADRKLDDVIGMAIAFLPVTSSGTRA